MRTPIVALGAIALSGCINTPAYNSAAISATDGKDGVTVEGRYTCSWIAETGIDGAEAIAKAAGVDDQAQRYCGRHSKTAEPLSIALLQPCTHDDDWNGIAGSPGVYRVLYACVGADQVEIVDD